MATTVITDETVTISLRMGAALAMAAIGDGTADIVYTLPGEAEQTDALAGTVSRVYGPYPFGQDFVITATDSVQAVTTFGTITANATIQQVDSLPALGAPNVIYQTATAAYWWNGVAFIAMGSGASGAFTTLTVSGNATLGDTAGDTHTVNGTLKVVGAPVQAFNGGFVAGNNVGLAWNGNGGVGVTFTAAGAITITPEAAQHLAIANMPTSSAGLPAGALWSDGGTIKIV